MAVSYLMWVLGIKLGSSGRAILVLNHGDISEAPHPHFFEPRELSPGSFSRLHIPKTSEGIHRHKPWSSLEKTGGTCTLDPTSSRNMLVLIVRDLCDTQRETEVDKVEILKVWKKGPKKGREEIGKDGHQVLEI